MAKCTIKKIEEIESFEEEMRKEFELKKYITNYNKITFDEFNFNENELIEL